MISKRDPSKPRREAPLTARRLGRVECALLALIGLGVVITVVMAVVSP